jgi:hypothetical protein
VPPNDPRYINASKLMRKNDNWDPRDRQAAPLRLRPRPGSGARHAARRDLTGTHRTSLVLNVV